MPVHSPIGRLREILAQVKQNAITYQTQLAASEAATRLALVDPILSALGWDMANPSMVAVEQKAQPMRADYVVYSEDAKPMFVVEAKPLNANISAGAAGQLFATAAYVQANERKRGLITNGLKWAHYEDETALSNHSCIWTADLATDNLQAIASHLIHHLDASRFWPEEKDDLSAALLQAQLDYAALQERVTALENGTAPPPTRKLQLKWVEIDQLPNATRTTPSWLRLPDATELPIHSWRQALISACEYTLNSTASVPLPLPDSASGKVNLLSAEPTPRSQEVTSSQGVSVFVYTTYSANACVANIKHILKLAPVTAQSVKPAVVFS